MQLASGKRIDAVRAADLIRDAGGNIVGKTRIQKIAYFLEVVGAGGGFEFNYRHYGPYSEDLALSLESARRLDQIQEDEQRASWGGTYSIFRAVGKPTRGTSSLRKQLIEATLNCNSVALELAATAHFIRWREHMSAAWEETARRKPDKADKLQAAKDLYSGIRQICPKLPVLN